MMMRFRNTSGAELNKDELVRYNRHIMLPEVGIKGQEKLKRAKILVVGAGGLGSPACLYLAAAGVGTLGIIDSDSVDVSNLQRQILFGSSDVGRPKVLSAQDRIREINPHVHVEVFKERLTSRNALDVLRNFDVIVDGSDNFPTRYLVNDACVMLNKPCVYGSIFRFEGQASVFWAEKGACYRCLYPEPPPPGSVPSCAEGGVLGVLPGIIGSIQANEAIKLILGTGETLVNRLLLFDALAMSFRELNLGKDPDCPVCGKNPAVKELIDYEVFCGVKKADESGAATTGEISARELKRMIDQGRNVQLLDVREPHEINIAQLPNTLHIPMNAVMDRLYELDPARDVVVFCRSGGRSARVIQHLKNHGYAGRLINLKGGILAWSDDVDPSVSKY